VNSKTKLAHQPSSGDFFPCLDGIRGLAVLGVVIFHTVHLNPNSWLNHVILCFTKSLWMCVPVFFVLSGFLISYTVFKNADKFDAFSYSARRFGKIGPPYILALIVFGGLLFFWKHPDNLAGSVLAYATTLAHFQNGWACLNPAFWSLMVEIHFYTILPLLYFGFRRISRFPEWLTLAVFLIVPPVIRLTTHLPASASMDDWFWHANLFPRAMDNFALGILFAILYTRFRGRAGIAGISSRIAHLGFFVMLATYCVHAFLEWRFPMGPSNRILYFETFRYLAALSTFLLLFLVFIPTPTALHRALGWPALAFVGLISYEWFLFHQPPIQFLEDLLQNSHGGLSVFLLRTVAPTVVTFAASAFVYFYISAPILSKIKTRLQNRNLARKQRVMDKAT